MSGWQGAVRISRLAWNQTRSVIKPWPILYPSAILKSALRFCFLSGFCVTKWRQTLCPAIGCRHSVRSKTITISKPHFCTHLFNTHTTYCIHLTIYCHLYWKSSCRWLDSAPGHHFPASKSMKTQENGGFVLYWDHFRDRFVDHFASKSNLKASVLDVFVR